MAEARVPSTGPVLFYWRDTAASVEKLCRTDALRLDVRAELA